MDFVSTTIFDFAVLGGGVWAGRRYPLIRHRHDWEVVEKTPVKGTNLDDAIRASKASSYAHSLSEIMKYVRDEQMIVHYRCLCGAEKVERI